MNTLSPGALNKEAPPGRRFLPDGAFHMSSCHFIGRIEQKNREAGNDLLSREANRSTIGAGGLNCRVRHGTGWTPSAIVTCFSVQLVDVPVLRTSSTEQNKTETG